MSPCRRCDGVLVRDWDVESRTMFLRCVQCSNRPLQVTYRADGLPIGAPLLCVACHQSPRASRWSNRSKEYEEIAKCEACSRRDQQRQLQYSRKARKRKVGA